MAVVAKLAAAEQEMHDEEEHDDVMAEHRGQPEPGNLQFPCGATR